MSLNLDETAKKIKKLKVDYDKSRTEYAIAKEKIKEIKKKMKGYGVTSKNIKEVLNGEKEKIEKAEKELNSLLDEADEVLG